MAQIEDVDSVEFPELTHFKFRRMVQGVARVANNTPEVMVALENSATNPEQSLYALPALMEHGPEEIERIVALAMMDNTEVKKAAKAGKLDNLIRDRAQDLVMDNSPGTIFSLAARAWNEVLKDELGKIPVIQEAVEAVKRLRRQQEQETE